MTDGQKHGQKKNRQAARQPHNSDVCATLPAAEKQTSRRTNISMVKRRNKQAAIKLVEHNTQNCVKQKSKDIERRTSAWLKEEFI